MLYLTRRERFSSAHKLWVDEWSAEKNLDEFGGCANPNWHGHNYQLWVTVRGKSGTDTGFVMNLKQLSNLIHEYVIQYLDHKNINLDCPFMKGRMSTTEHLAVGIWEQLAPHVTQNGVELFKIRIQETENNQTEYFGEGKTE